MIVAFIDRIGKGTSWVGLLAVIVGLFASDAGWLAIYGGCCVIIGICLIALCPDEDSNSGSASR